MVIYESESWTEVVKPGKHEHMEPLMENQVDMVCEEYSARRSRPLTITFFSTSLACIIDLVRHLDY